LLILSAVTLNMIIGPNGIIKKAQKAREETQVKTAQEELELIITQAKTELITQGKTNPEPQETAKQIQKDQNEKVDMVIT
ncbi:hypothetical protein, partial [uncultured Desulfovibrio sp.]|uniref:hypothetical protein n=1 Tax=uncultured Desulfovibrio sp. TaxID=167968 RepID=UPI00261E755C